MKFEFSKLYWVIRDHVKPFFNYNKEDTDVEFLYLKSMEDLIRLKDLERDKAKLLEMIQGEHLDKDESKNGQD